MRKMFYLMFAATFILFCSSGFAQTYTTYIRALDNNGVLVNGGSTAPGHLKEIESLSYSIGIAKCITCQPDVSDYSFMMILNPGTITLKQLSLKGLHLQSVDITYHRSTNNFDFYKIHMEDVVVESVQDSGSSETPTIAVSIKPARIAWMFTATNSDGLSAGQRTKGGWDVVGQVEWIYY
jgi:type VI protein secretion system component Hcp